MSKILLVEDDNNLREIYEARLQAEGYEIATAKDGEEALVVAKKERPDLIIADVMMPRISGFEMLDILRNTEGMKDVRVIMLTALGQAEDKTRADQLGADRYLVKSQVTLEDIVKTASDLLAGVPSNAAAAAAAVADAPAPTTPTATVPVVAAPPAAPAPAIPVAAPPAEPTPAPQLPTPTPPAPVPTPPVTPAVTPPAPAPPITSTTPPAAPPAPSTDQANSAQLADAVQDLVSSVGAPTPPTTTPVPTPSAIPAPAQPTDTTQPTPADSHQATAVNGDNVTIARKKIIQPLAPETAQTPPDLNELLAREGIDNLDTHTASTPMTGSANGTTIGTPPHTYTTPHPPGHVISPGAPGANTPNPNNPIDPNAISL